MFAHFDISAFIIGLLLAPLANIFFRGLTSFIKSHAQRFHTVDGRMDPYFVQLRQLSDRISNERETIPPGGRLSYIVNAIELLHRK
jgi:hypothetical protein